MTQQNKNVPKLRFPEFSEEWNESKLKDVTTYADYRGKTPTKTSHGTVLVTAKNIKMGFIDYECSKEYVNTCDIDKIMSRGKPSIGDVLFTTEAPMGNVAQVDKKDIALAQRVIKFCGTEDLNNSFLKFLMMSSPFRKVLNIKSIGSTVQGIKGKELHNIKIKIPERDEQQKIADFLSAVDERVEGLRRKKELLERYKKGVMQKIFSQEIRFTRPDGTAYPEWGEVYLGDIATATTGSSNREDSTETGQYAFFDRSNDTRASSKYIYDCEAIIVAGEGKDFPPKYFIGKFDLHQRAYAVMNFGENNGKFIYYMIDKSKHFFLRNSVGSTMPSLRMQAFTKFPLSLPHPDEQNLIADFLTSVDKKVEATALQLEEAQKFKKALLQQMFV